MNVTNIINFSKKIEAGNVQFDKLSKAEKRVAIAKDAIAQLLIDRYVPTPGTYVGSDDVDLGMELDIAKTLTSLPQCNVCAIGSVMVSSFRCGQVAGDLESMRDGYHAEGELSYDEGLRLAFSDAMLRRMEDAFESGGRYGSEDPETKWGLLNKDERLFAILETVIEKGGRFPSVAFYDYGNNVPKRDLEWARDVKTRFAKAKLKALKVPVSLAN